MKKYGIAYSVGLVLVALATAAWVQGYDLAGSVDLSGATAKPVHANAADSGTRLDRAGYGSAMFSVFTGQADNGTATGNVVVLLDSTPGVAGWNLVDSITVDTVDNKTYKLPYRGTRRWIRLLARASGQAADTFAIYGVGVLGNKRAR